MYVYKDLKILLRFPYIFLEKSLLRSLSWVLLHIRGMNYKFHSLFLKGKWLVWLERKLISAHQQPYGGRSGLSQSNPKDCIWLIISKHNRQISRGPPLLRFILAMTKVIMTRGEGKKKYLRIQLLKEYFLSRGEGLRKWLQFVVKSKWMIFIPGANCIFKSKVLHQRLLLAGVNNH